MSDIILDVQNLSIAFKQNKGVDTVHDISFQLKKGKTLAIVGESGSGKSISALSIMQLLPSRSANIRANTISFEENNLLGLDQKSIQKYRGGRLAYIFQEPLSSFNPSMTCGKQVEEMLLLHTDLNALQRKEHILKLFGDVAIHDPQRAFDSYPHQLSGGQLQRIMIAMAIACQPSILIADEPTTALDVTVQRQIVALLKDIQDRYDMSILFISHDLGIVREIADDIIVMNKGKIVESGDAAQVLTAPNHAYTKHLLACRPSLEHRRHRLYTVQEMQENADPQSMDHLITSEEYKDRLNMLEQQDVILDVKNLSKTYATKKSIFRRSVSTKVLHDVNFSLRKGETLGIVGESGSGKSTIAKIIMGLTDMDSGSIIYQGRSLQEWLRQDQKAYRKEVQMIFQDPYSALNPRIKVGDCLMEPMKAHGMSSKTERKNYAEKLLHDVGLHPSDIDKYPHQFSGGQRQRINIARALAVRPSLIICDESVSALDVSVQAMVLNTLQTLKDQYKLSYIFISHDIAVIYHISDTVAVLDQGKMVEHGDVETVIKSPQHAYTQKLLNAVMV